MFSNILGERSKKNSLVPREKESQRDNISAEKNDFYIKKKYIIYFRKNLKQYEVKPLRDSMINQSVDPKKASFSFTSS